MEIKYNQYKNKFLNLLNYYHILLENNLVELLRDIGHMD